MIKAISGTNTYLHALSRGAFVVHREAYGSLPVIIRREAAMPEETQALHRMLRQIAPEQVPFDRIATHFFDYGIPKAKITREIVDPLAVVIAETERFRWLSLRYCVDTSALIDHPSEMVKTAIAAMTQDGAKPIVPTGQFVEGAARAYAKDLGAGGGSGGGGGKSLEGEHFSNTLARMHEVAASCIHGLIRWQ